MTAARNSRRNTRKLSRKISLSKTRKNYSNIMNINWQPSGISKLSIQKSNSKYE